MSAVYTIRQATAADIESVARLERAIPNAPHWPVAAYLAALSPVSSAAEVRGAGSCFFVAVAGENLVGFAVGRVTELEGEAVAELGSVAVADTMRRAGIGRALCEAVIGWSRARGAAEIDLEVRSRSGGAIALYLALGFAVVGARAKYYRNPVDDAVLMRLDLSKAIVARPHIGS